MLTLCFSGRPCRRGTVKRPPSGNRNWDRVTSGLSVDSSKELQGSIRSMDQVIQICNAFLVTNGLFFTALSAAATENDKLKVGLSIAGLLVSALLFVSARSRYAEVESITTHGTVLSTYLPLAFAIGWIVSLVIHLAALRRLRQG